jgi:hypothetical protein
MGKRLLMGECYQIMAQTMIWMFNFEF